MILLLAAFSCSQQEPDIPTPKLTFAEKVDSDFERVTLTCAVSGNVAAEKLSIEYSKDKAIAGAQRQTLEKKGDSFEATITGLEIQTTYYYRYTVENKASSFADEKIRQFKTKDYVVPEVSTVGAKDISGTMATLEGNVDFACGKPILERGFKVGKDKNALETKKIEGEGFSLKVDGMEFETTYYYQAYAKTEIGTGYGVIKEFKTNNAVSFKSITISDVLATSAKVSGGIEDNGGIDIEKQGFRYSESGSESFEFVESAGEMILSGLKPATLYNVWYYAKTFEGEFESEKVELTTQDGLVLIITSSPENVTTTSAVLKGIISSDGGSAISERGFCYAQKEMPSVADIRIKVVGTTGAYQYSLTDLPQNKTYYVRAYAINAMGTYYGDPVSFTTLYDSVIFGTTSCSNVTASSASIKGSITSNGGSTVTKCGFCYSTSANPTIDDQLVEVTDSKTNLVATIKNLKSGMSYHVRAFATNANSTFYSNEITFVTEDGIIQFAAPELSNTAAESVVATCGIISSGGGTITERGFCYGLTKNPTTSNSIVKASGTSGNYSCTISGLKNNTVYYIRAYAINESGTYYSAEVTVTTLSGIATVSTSAASNVKALSATISGEIVSDGGSNITERGFCYGTSANPTTNSTVVKINGTVGSITKDLTNLDKATKYYVRAYAINGYGTHYGEEVSFSTFDGVVIFSNTAVTDVTPTSMMIQTTIITDGGSDITEKGFCYSTDENPSIASTVIKVSSSGDNYSFKLSSLPRGTRFFVKAYAKNKIGVYYSEQLSATTNSGVAKLSNLSVSNVAQTTADVSANVIEDGGATISSRGFCFSKTPKPTTNSSKTIVAGTTGTMSTQLTGLSSDCDYYVRAFATTEFGTVYTEDVIIHTIAGIASLGSSYVDEVNPTTLVFHSSLTSLGGTTVNNLGVCYSTTKSPTISENVINVPDIALGDFAITVSNIEQATTYYLRAFATTQYGTSYGEEITVTTPYNPTVLGSVIVSDVLVKWATLSGSVVSDGGIDITERGFCIGTSANPQNSTIIIPVTGTVGSFSTTAKRLNPNTNYYVFAYAKNRVGTFYSSPASFKTIKVPEGAAPGVFRLEDSYGVFSGYCFVSKGNLEQSVENETWHFAECQYEKTNNYNDAFKWGTDGVTGTEKRYDYEASCDWGNYKIDNGGNTANYWRTPTMLEMGILTYYPQSYNGSVNGGASVITIDNNMRGLAILPFDWDCPVELEDCFDGRSFTKTSFTKEQWTALDQSGAVLFYGEKIAFDYGPTIYYNELGSNTTGTIAYWTSSTRNPFTDRTIFYPVFSTPTNTQFMSHETYGTYNFYVRLIKTVNL